MSRRVGGCACIVWGEAVCVGWVGVVGGGGGVGGGDTLTQGKGQGHDTDSVQQWRAA